MNMNTIRKTLLCACATLCLIGSAYANEGHEQHGMQGMQGAHTPPTLEQVQAHFAERLAKLHTKLNLQASQEAAWTAFAAAITPSTLPVHPGGADLSLPAPERAQKMLDGLKQHEAIATAHVAALKTFYAALSPEQQKTFDANFKMMRPHGPRGHHQE
jgi:hypothetical protein